MHTVSELLGTPTGDHMDASDQFPLTADAHVLVQDEGVGDVMAKDWAAPVAAALSVVAAASAVSVQVPAASR